MHTPKNSFRLKSLIVFVLSIFLFASCIDDEFEFDPDKIDLDIVYDPNVAVTLGTVNIDLGELLKDYDSTVLSTDTEGMFFVRFEQDLFSFKGDEKITVPAPAPVIIPAFIFPPAFTSNSVYRDTVLDGPINFGSNQKIDSMILKTMSLEVVGTSNFSYDGELSITLENVKKSNSAYTLVVPITKSSGGVNVPLNKASSPESALGYKLTAEDLGNGETGLSIRVGLRLFGSPGQVINPFENLDVDIYLKDLSYKLMYGYVGKYTLMDLKDSLDLGFLGRSLAQNIEWMNPQAKIYLENSYSVPVKFDIDEMAIVPFGSNDKVDVTPNSSISHKSIAIPSDVYQPVEDSIVFNKINSFSLFNAFEKAPRKLSYSFKATCNPDEVLDKSNIIADSSMIKGKIVFELPLFLRSSGVESTDTMDFDFGGDETKIKSMLFRVVSNNELPVDMLLQVRFLDENFNSLATLFNEDDTTRRIIRGGKVDLNGNVEKISNYVQDVVFSNNALEALSKAKKIVYTTRVVTAGYNPITNTGPYVKFKKGLKLKMTFITQVQAQTKIDL